MAANATAKRPIKVPAAKQPPANSVWIRYHPWIEGVMAHISSWSIHLLVIGGAILWFTYLAYVFGFARPPHSLPMEAVRLEIPGGGGSRTGSGTQKGGGDHAAPTEGSASNKNNPGEKTKPIDASERPKLTDIEAKKVDESFAPADARYIKQHAGSMQTFANLDKDLRDKLRDGINPSQGKASTGTGGGTGAGTGTGTGSGTGAGKEGKLTEREKRMGRWVMHFRTHGPGDYLRQLQAVGAVLAIPVGRNSFTVIDLKRQPWRQQITSDLPRDQIWWSFVEPESVQGILLALGLPVRTNQIIAFIPKEVEDELAKKELAYQHLKEDDIFETNFEVQAPGFGGRRYDIQVIDQKRK